METVLTDETWAWIERTGRRVTFGPGDSLLHEGDDTAHVYAIRSGTVKLVVHTRDGDELLLAMRSANQTVGELAAIDPGPRQTTVVAKDHVVAWVLTAEQYLRLLHEVPGAAVAQLRAVITRFRESIHHHVERSDELASRVSSRLLALLAGSGDPRLVLTQSELAAWVGATREATARSLGQLRTAGAIETARGTITVVDAERLAEFC